MPFCTKKYIKSSDSHHLQTAQMHNTTCVYVFNKTFDLT